MNLTICGKTEKSIRNWERQCFPCIHARLVTLREQRRSEIYHYGGIFLYDCPHVRKKFKLIGKNSHRDVPMSDTRLIHLNNIYLPGLSASTYDMLVWQELIPPPPSVDKSWIAEIPRPTLKKELCLNIPLKPEPCPICQKQAFAPCINALIQP